MSSERSVEILDRNDIEEMVRCIAPAWTIKEVSSADGGLNSVHHVTLETETRRRSCVLKSSPGNQRNGCTSTEARYLSVLAERTSIPVPDVVGVVDEHEELEAPFFLMDSADGTPLETQQEEPLSDSMLQRIARQSGRYLAQLHMIDAPNLFGIVRFEPSPPLEGTSPTADPSGFTVPNGSLNWTDCFRDWFFETTDNLSETRFDDLVPALKTEVEERIDELPNAFQPVLARIDHRPENLLVSSDDGSIEALLDWGAQFCVAPTYDLATVEFMMAGGGRLALPGFPDRRLLVRDALLTGYRRETTVPKGFERQRQCYQLNLFAESMNRLAAGYYPVSDDVADSVANWFRETVEESFLTE